MNIICLVAWYLCLILTVSSLLCPLFCYVWIMFSKCEMIQVGICILTVEINKKKTESKLSYNFLVLCWNLKLTVLNFLACRKLETTPTSHWVRHYWEHAVIFQRATGIGLVSVLCLHTQFCSISCSHSFWLTLIVSHRKFVNHELPFLVNIYDIRCKFNKFYSFINIALGKRQAVFSKDELQERDMRRKGGDVITELRHYLQNSGSLNGK